MMVNNPLYNKALFSRVYFSHLANGHRKKKFERLIFPTKYVIPKSLSRLAIGKVSFLPLDIPSSKKSGRRSLKLQLS